MEIAKVLYEIADFLEATKDRFRARAYRKAANVISNLEIEIENLQSHNFDLQELPYIGINIAAIINKILKNEINPLNLVISGKFISRKIQKPPFRLHNAKKLKLIVMRVLKQVRGITDVYPVGELRRCKEVINNLEFLALTDKSFSWEVVKKNKCVSHFEKVTKYKANLTILNNISITLNVTNDKNIGIDLLFLTGSDKHLQGLQKKLHQSKQNIQKKTEKEIYQSIKLSYIEPELREDRGEIKAAAQNTLPQLIQLSDIKGDLHCHTNETDGVLTLAKVVEYALAMDYEYLAITDHSQSLKITRGLDKKRLFKQIDAIDKINAKLKNFTILKSSECDILEDGSLDFPKDVLKELDLVVCSVHSRFRIPKEKQTERIIRAIENPYCTILGHPTGRLIMSRIPYEIDIDKILKAAKSTGCILELNCQPYRLDLKDEYCLQAKKLGIKIAISSDAHSLRGFQFIELGISQARRAGLEAKDVINTYSLKDMKKLLRKI